MKIFHVKESPKPLMGMRLSSRLLGSQDTSDTFILAAIACQFKLNVTKSSKSSESGTFCTTPKVTLAQKLAVCRKGFMEALSRMLYQTIAFAVTELIRPRINAVKMVLTEWNRSGLNRYRRENAMFLKSVGAISQKAYRHYHCIRTINGSLVEYCLNMTPLTAERE